MDISKFVYDPRVMRICKQLRDHIGIHDEDLAIFLLNLGTKHPTFNAFKKAIINPPAANNTFWQPLSVHQDLLYMRRNKLSDSFISNVLEIIQQVKDEPLFVSFNVKNDHIRRRSQRHCRRKISLDTEDINQKASQPDTNHRWNYLSKRKVSLSIKDVNQEGLQPDANHRWDHLPSVVMHEIFSYLKHEDRINSSLVCWNWHQAFLHPHFWKKITFRLSDSQNISWASNLAEHFGCSVEHVTIKCHMPCYIPELNLLLLKLRNNRNLRRLFIEPIFTPVTDDQPIINVQPWIKTILRKIEKIIETSEKMEALTLGFIEGLAGFSEILVDMLADHHGQHLTHLALASIKKAPYICQLTFERFKSIKHLTIDYENLNDAVLASFTSGTLRRLVVHVHERSKNHPDTSNAAWKAFKENNKHCELHLTFLWAHKTIDVADRKILKPEMPLTHFAALYCENANIALLNKLSLFYHQTLKSVIWIDSISRQEFRPRRKTDLSCTKFIQYITRECDQLEEMIYIGQVYDSDCDEPILYIVQSFGYFISCEHEIKRFTKNGCLYDVRNLQLKPRYYIDDCFESDQKTEVMKMIEDALHENREAVIQSVLL